MHKKFIFLISLLLIFNSSLVVFAAEEKKIAPLKKPLLTDKELKNKVLVNILKPLSKPKKKVLKDKQKKVEKKDEKIKFLIPKKKPLIAGSKKTVNIKISKYYSKKDFGLAKKAISDMKKANWTTAIKTANKAKDKSIYNFVQWRHLLTAGNKASYYDYKKFIDSNENYPRINRIKYLAEHKLSTNKVSPKKIIAWFNDSEPLSGFGKMILGESLILNGDNEKGIKLIKSGWISADLSKNDLKFYRKKFKKYLNAEDYIKRADYLAWNNKYWDLKRLLRYLPKDYELLYNARQLLMSKSY